MPFLKKVRYKITAKGFEGITRQKAETIIHKTLDPIFKGVFRDNYWKPIQEAMKALAALDIYPQTEKADYYHKEGNIEGKKWILTIPFGEKGGWHLQINASFGPSAVGTTDAYDVIYTLNWDGRMKPEN